MRSWLSDSIISYGVMPSSRHGTLFMSSRMPALPLVAISTLEEVKTGCAHVLNGDDRVCSHQLKTGFDQKLFCERVTDLNRWTLCFCILFKVGARHRRAMNTIAAGFRTDIDNRVSNPGGSGIEDLVSVRDANTSSR